MIDLALLDSDSDACSDWRSDCELEDSHIEIWLVMALAKVRGVIDALRALPW